MSEVVKGKGSLRCAVVGYGPAFNRGTAHCGWIKNMEGLELVAACDLDKARIEAARNDFPWIETHNGLDLVTIVTPRNTHVCLIRGSSGFPKR